MATAQHDHTAARRSMRSPEALNNRGARLLSAGDGAAAVALFRAALVVQPDHLAAHTNLVTALRRAARFDEAAQAVDAGLRAHPDGWLLHFHRAALLARHEDVAADVAAAEAAVRRALALAPDRAAAWEALGTLLAGRQALEQAMACCARALALEPGYAAAWRTLVAVQLSRREYAAAWPALYAERTRALDAACARDPWPDRWPEWTGDALDGRTILVLMPLMAHGEALLYVRYLKVLRDRYDTTITVVCDPALVRLFAACPYIAHVLTADDPVPRFDVCTAGPSLPHLLGDLDEVAATVPYLRAPDHEPSGLSTLVQRPGTTLSVGLVWGGRTTPPANPYRSIPFATLAPLLDVPGVQFYSLQLGPQAAERALHPRGDRVVDLAPQLRDFADTAAVIAHLDLVITVDTSVANLAGALGSPAWVLLKRNACWRWGAGGPTSPWYPSARLFRQPDYGAWGAVVAEVRDALAEAARQHAAATDTTRRAV